MLIEAGAWPSPAIASIAAEELAALIAERHALAGALRVATTEPDLALQRLRLLRSAA